MNLIYYEGKSCIIIRGVLLELAFFSHFASSLHITFKSYGVKIIKFVFML